MPYKPKDPRIPKSAKVAEVLTELGPTCSDRSARGITQEGRLPLSWNWRGVRAILEAADDPWDCLDALCDRQEQNR